MVRSARDAGSRRSTLSSRALRGVHNSATAGDHVDGVWVAELITRGSILPCRPAFCIATGAVFGPNRLSRPHRAEGAFDASERSTDELGAPGASQESGGCKHQSSSHPAGGRAAGIGQVQSRDHIVEAWWLDCRCVRPGQSAPGDSLRGEPVVRCPTEGRARRPARPRAARLAHHLGHAVVRPRTARRLSAWRCARPVSGPRTSGDRSARTQ